MSKEEIKAQFDSVVEQLNGELSKLPESVERRLKDLRSASKDDPKMFLNI